ncbi:HORMA domain-containing protein 1 [Toxocara canis]|uniref:HORMA domain-containing protein 1 n=1 Tax=Toxocara canis TaxID=6265 RepID=A0A0B2V580_TOXCA|nr:HORMA domain-containing protein 1 [Toxocara canis]
MSQQVAVNAAGTETKDATWWEKASENGDGSDHDSAEFLHGTLSVLVSEIFFQRGLLSLRHFTPIRVHKIKTAIMGDVTRQGRSFWMLMNGVLDAIRKRYLRKMMVVISEHAREDIGAMEVYKFSITYTEEGYRIVSRDSQGTRTSIIAYKGRDELRKQVASILRELHEVTINLEKLPKNAAALIKLTYYSNAPSDYEPQGFERAETLYYFDRVPHECCLGSFHCKLLSCKINVASLFTGMSTSPSQHSHSTGPSEHKTDSWLAAKAKKQPKVVEHTRLAANRLNHHGQNSKVNSAQVVHNVDGSSTTLRDGATVISTVPVVVTAPVMPPSNSKARNQLEQRSGSAHNTKLSSPPVTSEKILAGNLEPAGRMRHAVVMSEIKKREQEGGKKMGTTGEILRRPPALNTKGTISTQLDNTIDLSSDKSSRGLDDHTGPAISKNTEPLGSFSHSDATEMEEHIGSGSNRRVSGGSAKGRTSQKRPYGSQRFILLSSDSLKLSMDKQEAVGGELCSQRHRKVSRMDGAPFPAHYVHGRVDEMKTTATRAA